MSDIVDEPTYYIEERLAAEENGRKPAISIMGSRSSGPWQVGRMGLPRCGCACKPHQNGCSGSGSTGTTPRQTSPPPGDPRIGGETYRGRYGTGLA
jgi:hypothetical protein